MAKTEIKKVRLSDIKPNPDNPRRITGEQMDRLVKSLTDFPEMMELREIVVDETMMVLGGNMRLQALRKIGAKDVRAKIVSGLTPEQKREFVIKDNAAFGEWDFDALANGWGDLPLNDWGLRLPKEFLNDYSKNIKAPIYTPKDEKPAIDELLDETKMKELVNKIDLADITEDEKYFLRAAAQRHIVFNYKKIADYYAHSPKIMQNLMEDSALVIIDFSKAVEDGYIKLSEEIIEQFKADHGNG